MSKKIDTPKVIASKSVQKIDDFWSNVKHKCKREKMDTRKVIASKTVQKSYIFGEN